MRYDLTGVFIPYIVILWPVLQCPCTFQCISPIASRGTEAHPQITPNLEILDRQNSVYGHLAKLWRVQREQEKRAFSLLVSAANSVCNPLRYCSEPMGVHPLAAVQKTRAFAVNMGSLNKHVCCQECCQCNSTKCIDWSQAGARPVEIQGPQLTKPADLASYSWLHLIRCAKPYTFTNYRCKEDTQYANSKRHSQVCFRSAESIGHSTAWIGH